MKTFLTEALGIDFPLIMAPMHYVSNVQMVKEAMKNGIAGTFPSLNYRKDGELESVLDELNNFKATQNVSGTYGINLIVGKSNPLYEKHLKICVGKKVPFYITSLGNPKQVIEAAHSYGAKVLSDVTNLKHAQKAFEMQADGFIAVGQGAGGHAGPYPLHLLIPSLRREFPNLPIIAAGGISTGEGILSMLTLGASGVSMGTRFISSLECSVSQEYKDGIVNASMEDVILTDRLTGTPSAVIYNDFIKKLGVKQGFFERTLSNNKWTKKYFKMYIQIRGMKWLEGKVIPGSKDSLWMAGQSVELIKEIKPIAQIINDLKKELNHSYQKLLQLNG
jgi:nitronate monooxygenase